MHGAKLSLYFVFLFGFAIAFYRTKLDISNHYQPIIKKLSNSQKDSCLASAQQKDFSIEEAINDNILKFSRNSRRLSPISDQEFVRAISPLDYVEKYQEALNLGYHKCERVTHLFSKTFYTGSTLMREDVRRHIWAIYTWCRRTDDIVDSPRALANTEILSANLQEWEKRLEGIWKGEAVDLYDLAMVDTVRKYPSMNIQPYKDMIMGMVMDVPGLGQDRYANFEELYLYCYRVAGTVGLMTLPIVGTVNGFTQNDAIEPAIALGIGFQLTNILRDVGEDLLRNRIYLPQDEIVGFGMTEEDIIRGEVTEKYKAFMKFQIARARKYYKTAEEGIRVLSPEVRFAVQTSLDLYRQILSVIERNNYDNFRKRAYTSTIEKLSALPCSLMKSINASITTNFFR